ncbi:MAG TPA: carboxypeptidase regulatory-like domain-containing protein [Candidatus Dormibacteraeota bacterium]|nr:carboxypeptidase regulatory-like domain-containing protein [Candidatus Dormibacteraeota bacterium]
MKHIGLMLLAGFVSLFLIQSARAQGVGASGELTGTVTDPSGAAVANATVTASLAARGFQRGATTDGTGEYRFAGLPPASYEVTATANGFEAVVQKSVTISVGQVTIADFHLVLSKVQQTVEVTTTPPTVNVEQSQQANTINERYITDLPINRRDYLTFTLLAPGVSNSTRLASDQDFRVKQTPQSGLSFYGSNGRGNSVTVDGGEANDDSGGVRLNVSQDAVQEFQINRSNYSADLGGASGASINIVTKSGTNNIHGSVYGYFRNDALDARDPFAFGQALAPGSAFSFNAQGLPVKNSLNRQQFGGTLGFPIKKNKTFMFVSFEGLHEDSQNAVPLLTNTSIFAGPTAASPTAFPVSDPRAAQQAIVSGLAAEGNGVNVPCLSQFNPGAPPTIVTLPAAVCAGALQSALTVSPTSGVSLNQNAVNNFLIGQLEGNGGLFPYNTREYLASARLDHQFGERDQAFLRYSYGHDLEESPDVQSLTGFSAGSSLHTYDNTLQGSWFHEFSAAMQNEARVQFDYNYTGVIPNEPGEVGLQIPGVASLGTNIFLPNRTILRRYEFSDNLTIIRGHHTFKFGADELLRGDHTQANTYMPGRFIFGSIPGNALSPCLSSPSLCGVTAFPAAIDPLQAASLGAPLELEQGFGTPVYAATRPYTALYWQDSWQVAPNFTFNYGLRYEMDTEPAPLNSDYNNVAPRISFAWDPFGDHKTVIRAGYGIFYGTTYFQIPDVVNTLGVLNANGSSVENQSSGNQVANAAGTCGILNFPIFPGNGSSPCNRKIGIYVVPLTGYPSNLGVYLNPNPTYTSATVFGGLFAQGLVQCTTPTAGNAACITPAALSPLIGAPITNSGAIPPASVLFSDQRNYQDPYSQQAELGIEREIAPGLSISASFIYSHTLHLPVALDTNILPAPEVTLPLANGKTATYRDWNINSAADPYSILTSQPSPCSANPFACFVNPLIAQNNRYSSAASALYEGGLFEIKKQYNNYFTLMANYTYSKAFDTTTDFNSDYAPQDQTNLNAERALSEFDQRNKVVVAAVADSPWKERILSGFELSPIFTYNSGHPFNLLAGSEVNGDNHPTNDRPIGSARNTGLGPNMINFDLALNWKYKLGESRSLQFMAQAFNLFNRTNYASVNNVVGPFFGLPTAYGGNGATTFNVHGIKPGTALPGGVIANPSTPLTFTSDFPKRQIQLAVRFEF